MEVLNITWIWSKSRRDIIKNKILNLQNGIIAVLLLIVLAKVGVYHKETISDIYSEQRYKYIVSRMDSVNIGKIDGILQNEKNFYLYIGSEQCPSCVRLIKNVKEIAKDNGVDKIYYLPINMPEDFSDDRIDKLFEENSLETIPALIFNDGKQITSISTQEIREYKEGEK